MSKTILQAFDGNNSEVPFWFMRQAGRYMAEYRALRQKAGSFLNLCLDSNYAAEVTMQPINFYSPSAAIIFADILLVPMAMGQELDYKEGEGPILGDLNISSLNYDQSKVQPVFDALGKVKSQLPDNTALIGFAGSPFTVASYMIEGKSPKDFLKTKQMMSGSKQDFDKIVDILVENSTEYLLKQIESGAEVIQLFDSWAGVLDEDNFDKYVIKPNAKIIDNIKSKHPNIKIIGFPKGAGIKYKDYLQQTTADGISVDWTMPLEWIKSELQSTGKLVQGNFDPAILCTDKTTIKAHADKILDSLSDGKFIFNLGHGIIQHTPPENAEYLASIIKNYR